MIGWLVDTLLATSLLMAVVLLVREPVRRYFGPAAAYALWLIPALRLIMPQLTTTIERIVPTAQPHLLPQSAQLSVMGPSLLEQVGGWETLAVAAWLIGALTMLLSGFLIYRWQRRQVLRDSIELSRLGNIRIVRSAAVRGPIAFGIFNRIIALPIDFDDRYDAHERQLALDHEISHHRSGDLIVSHFAFAVLCLQWFNPLAWLSHRAFRFDQEAACDARVLDKVNGENRGAYAHAIAKAASGISVSGGALLFAGALDRPRTLHRRLASMLTRPSRTRRIAGTALIALAAAVALPLTASHATEYVDVPARQVAATTPVAAPAADPVVLHATRVPNARDRADAGLPLPDLGGVVLGKNDVAFFGDDTVYINQKRMRLDQLTGAERARLRAVILKSQRDQARERAELPQRLAEAQRQLDRARNGELRRELIRDRDDLRRDLAEIDTKEAELRAAGEDPEKRRAEVRESLREYEEAAIDNRVRETIEDSDPAKIEAALLTEEQQMARMLATLDELDGR